MKNLDLLFYWSYFCKNISDETDRLCFWKHPSANCECLAEWEYSEELSDFMSDWEEYTSES